MLYRSQKGFQRLTGQSASCAVGNRNGKHQRNLTADCRHRFLGRINGSLGIQRVENRFDEQQIHPSLYQRLHLFLIGRSQFVKSQCPITGIVHVWTHRTGLVRRSHRTGYPTRLFRGKCRKAVSCPTCDACGLQIDFTATVLQMIVGHGNALGAECIGFDNVCSGLQIGLMNLLNQFRTGNAKHIIVTLHLSGQIAEAFTTKVLFTQMIILDHSSKGSVQNQNTLSDYFLYCHVFIYNHYS